MNISEKQISAKLTTLLRKCGAKVIVLSANSWCGKCSRHVVNIHHENGIPDRIVVYPRIGPFFLEIKVGANQLSEIQEFKCQQLIDKGANVQVVRHKLTKDNKQYLRFDIRYGITMDTEIEVPFDKKGIEHYLEQISSLYRR